MNIRPLTDWLVVRFEPLAKRSDLIHLAGDEDRSAVRKGVVLAVGPGKVTKKGLTVEMGVQPGDHIAFLRWHQEHRPGKQTNETLARMSADVGGDVCMVRLADILFVYEGDVQVDV